MSVHLLQDQILGKDEENNVRGPCVFFFVFVFLDGNQYVRMVVLRLSETGDVNSKNEVREYVAMETHVSGRGCVAGSVAVYTEQADG